LFSLTLSFLALFFANIIWCYFKIKFSFSEATPCKKELGFLLFLSKPSCFILIDLLVALIYQYRII
jgi:hypothetical protein